MSNAKTKRAARSLGGMVLEPPITREEAGEYVKTEISAEAWAEICRAFVEYGGALDDLKTSRASRSKDPEKASWHERQTSTAKALEAALDRLQATRKHGEFLREASENYSLQKSNASYSDATDADRMLRDAHRLILDALVIVERAEPMEIELPTEANARAKLVRDVASALAKSEIEARASNGRNLDAITDRKARLSDLTPFEQLIDALGIGEEMTVASFSAFVRSALHGEKGGQASPLSLP
jgi:hypothetical protein